MPRRPSSIVIESTRNGMSSLTISITVCVDCQPSCSTRRVVDADRGLAGRALLRRAATARAPCRRGRACCARRDPPPAPSGRTGARTSRRRRPRPPARLHGPVRRPRRSVATRTRRALYRFAGCPSQAPRPDHQRSGADSLAPDSSRAEELRRARRQALDAGELDLLVAAHELGQRRDLERDSERRRASGAPARASTSARYSPGSARSTRRTCVRPNGSSGVPRRRRPRAQQRAAPGRTSGPSASLRRIPSARSSGGCRWNLGRARRAAASASPSRCRRATSYSSL